MKASDFLNKPEQANIVWLDKELDYDIALWFSKQIWNPSIRKVVCGSIKNTYLSLLVMPSMPLITTDKPFERVFNDPMAIRLISPIKIQRQIYPASRRIPHIGRVMAAALRFIRTSTKSHFST